MDGNPVNFQQILREIFPRTNVENIDNIIQMVVESNPLDSVEQKIENMINLLSGDGAQGPIPDINLEPNLFTELKAIFDNVDEEFLRNFVAQKPDEYDIEDAIQELSERNDLPQNTIDPLIILDQLKSALPDADPVYLEREAYKLANLTVEEIDNFLQNSIEKNDYPTMQDYLKNKKHHDELVFYKDGFDVNKFLEVIPNPNEKFTDPHRKLTLDENATESDLQIALNFLCNRYPFIRRINIERVLKVNKNLVTVCERFDKFNKNLRKPRPLEECNEDTENIALLQVIAYLQHRQLINRELKLKDETYRQAKEEARKYNLFEKCNCCFDDELIPEETFFCLKGCGFCKDCLKRGIEVCIGNGDIHFPCFNCSSEFSLYTLQLVLPTNTFERLTQRIISEEIKAAQIDGFETCPFCSYATILPDNEKIFKCKNEECLIESCRECKHQSHIPLRCNEIEYDEDVRRRTYIENQMTEALTRTCYSCHKKFIKSNGCNKMTCQCGARMCYLCGQAVTNYSHFSDKTCPLFTDDNQVNLQRIRRGVQKAKTELGNVQIKFDPSADIDAYFQ